MTNASDQAPSGRLIPIVLFLLFVGPLATAFLMYYGSGWRPTGLTNHGELLNPIVTLPESGAVFTRVGDGVTGDLKDAWWLLHVAPGSCGDACMSALETTRQVRLTLGHEADRVNRAMIGSGIPVDEHPDLFVSGPDKAVELLKQFDESAGSYVWVIDPLGNRVLRYPLDAPPAHFRDDLKKLLRKSRIG